MAEDGDTIDSYASPIFLLEQTAQHRGFCFHASTLYALLSFQMLRSLVGRRWCGTFTPSVLPAFSPTTTPVGENASVVVAAVSVMNLGGFFNSFCWCRPDCLPSDLNDRAVISKESSQMVR